MLVDKAVKPNRKLVLSKETVRILAGGDLLAAPHSQHPDPPNPETRHCSGGDTFKCSGNPQSRGCSKPDHTKHCQSKH